MKFLITAASLARYDPARLFADFAAIDNRVTLVGELPEPSAAANEAATTTTWNRIDFVKCFELHSSNKSIAKHIEAESSRSGCLIIDASGLTISHRAYKTEFYKYILHQVALSQFWTETNLRIIIACHATTLVYWNREASRFVHLAPMDFRSEQNTDHISRQCAVIIALASVESRRLHPKARLKRSLRAKLLRLKFW